MGQHGRYSAADELDYRIALIRRLRDALGSDPFVRIESEAATPDVFVQYSGRYRISIEHLER